jgi:hypothetical protein
MTDHTEEQLARRIAALPPAPVGWVKAAQELPAARKAIDSLIERAHTDARERETIMGDLEDALRREGVEPQRALLEELRGRLRDTG